MKKLLFLGIVSLFFFLFLPTLTPPTHACTPYCQYSCGCTQESCTGGTPAGKCCSTDNNRDCDCGCTPTYNGGTCSSCCLISGCDCGCQADTSGGYCKKCCNITGCACGCTATTGGGTCKSCCDAAHGGTTAPSTKCPCGCTANQNGGACKSCCLTTKCTDGCVRTTTTGGDCITCLKLPDQYCSEDPWGPEDSPGTGICRDGYDCFRNLPVPTNTPTPTTNPTPKLTPIPTLAPGGNCSSYNLPYCFGDASYICKASGPTPTPPSTPSLIWTLYEQCLFTCPASTAKCNTSTGLCCAATGQYCTTQRLNQLLCDSCGTNKYVSYCYTSYDAYLNGASATSQSCITTTTCGCTELWEKCGGTANPTTCANLGYTPPWVPHYNNCSENFCGPPCTTPVPTNAPIPSCTPNCTCGSALCVGSGQTCTDPVCGATCNATKTCTGTITAKAVAIDSTTTGCAFDTGSPTMKTGTTVTVAGSTKTQAATNTWMTWTSVGSGVYSPVVAPPSMSRVKLTCISENGGTYSGSNSSGTLTDGGTLAFLYGIAPQAGWVQVVGGNAYAAATLSSAIPSTVPAATRYFILKGAMDQAAGIASYGSSYDFSLDAGTTGEDMVTESSNWLIQYATVPTPTHFYTFFASQMDVPDSVPDAHRTSSGQIGSLTQPDCSDGTTPCVWHHDGTIATTTTPWTIASGQSVVLFVNGTLTINADISITPGGFLAIIVNGDIAVSSSVTTMDGIYIATTEDHTARFISETGTTQNKQLLVTGSVIADTFDLTRDLGATNNATLPAEQFVFDPQLLFTMPLSMQERPFIWQEVAP